MRIPNARIVKSRLGRPIIYSGVGVALYLLFGNTVVSALSVNGFDVSDTLIPAEEIHHGGPPKDGIPAIDRPVFLTSDQAGFLADGDRVLGLSVAGTSKAYPIRIMDWHEIVNDDFNGEPVVVSYCPLCGTGMAFDAEVAGVARTFGVSGLLYNSDVLLYDRQTESLWSQIMRKSIGGPMKGQTLSQLPMTHTTWRDWRARHPKTLVLSTETGHARDYGRSPYSGYETSANIYFPVNNRNQQYHPKEMVIGVDLDGGTKAYPFAELAKSGAGVADRVGNMDVRVEFDAVNRTGRVLDQDGEEIPSTIAFWFAWYAFFPQTEVYAIN